MKRLTIVLFVAGLLLAALLCTASLAAASPMASPMASPLAPDAGAPTVVSYQGQVAVSGTPFSGTGYFKFAFVNPAGTTSYWSNNGTSSAGSEPNASVPLTVTNGLFAVLLGDATISGMTQSLGPAAFGTTDATLRVWFSFTGVPGTFTRLIPDRRVAATPYALQAQFAASALDSVKLQGLSVGNAAMNVPSNSGFLNTMLDADLLDDQHASSFVNVTGGTMSGISASPILTVSQGGSGSGVYSSSDTGHGMYGTSNAAGRAGLYGVHTNAGGSGYAVFGDAAGSSTGGYFRSYSGTGLMAYGSLGMGIYAYAGPGTALAAVTNSGTGVYAKASAGNALYASGRAVITGTLTVSGNVTAPDLLYFPAKTDYFSLPSEAFQPASDVVYYNVGGAYLVSGAGGLVAPVHLPHGATVTEFKVYFYDNSASDLTIFLYRVALSNGPYGTMATLSTSGVPGYTSASAPSISFNPVDNANYAYVVNVYCSAWNSTNLEIKGVSIKYTISSGH